MILHRDLGNLVIDGGKWHKENNPNSSTMELKAEDTRQGTLTNIDKFKRRMLVKKPYVVLAI